jgi:phosphoserine phosphatase RsbU/P
MLASTATKPRRDPQARECSVPADTPLVPETSTPEDDVKRLRRAVRELSILNDLARDIGASLDSQHVTSTIIRRSLRAIGAEQGVIALVNRNEAGKMETLVRTVAGAATGQALHVQESLLGWMQMNKRPLLVNSPRDDERFPGVRWDESVRSLLCAPLLVKSELIGVLILFNKRGSGGFNEDDQRLLSILAAQSAQVVESARLHEEEARLRRFQEELRLASEIQLGLLPKSVPAIEGYDVAGRNIPAETVGGDYYDFIELGDGRVALCVADVSGKGLSASLLMANLQATIRAQTLLQLSPARCLEHSNALLARSTDLHTFATCFYAVLDPVHNELSYCNAGQDPPLLVSVQGEITHLATGGLVLGFMDGAEYEEETVPLNAGDVLILYSDGITDAEDPAGLPFGERRLLEAVRERSALEAGPVIDGILSAVGEHDGGQGRPDDMTIVVIKRKPA